LAVLGRLKVVEQNFQANSPQLANVIRQQEYSPLEIESGGIIHHYFKLARASLIATQRAAPVRGILALRIMEVMKTP
jgi:hypothetical protein